MSIDVEKLSKIKELLDNGAISQEEFDSQKKELLEQGKPKKQGNKGIIIIAIIVLVICVGIISSNTSDSENTQKTTTVQSENIPSEYSENFPINVKTSMYDNIIGMPELKCTFKNITNKEIAAIKMYFVPRDVYGEPINSIWATNDLYTDTVIGANDSNTCSWQFLDGETKSGDLYIYSVYFSDGSEWGNKDASTSEIKKYGYKISATY